MSNNSEYKLVGYAIVSNLYTLGTYEYLYIDKKDADTALDIVVDFDPKGNWILEPLYRKKQSICQYSGLPSVDSYKDE